jgi:hypothetical protein
VTPTATVAAAAAVTTTWSFNTGSQCRHQNNAVHDRDTSMKQSLERAPVEGDDLF